jgi:hypothetical protein
MQTTSDDFLVPATTMAFEWGVSRERLVRAVCAGHIAGELRHGRGLVDSRDGDRAKGLKTRSRTQKEELAAV